MSAPAGCQLIGRWRIVEADLWDRGYLDLCGPAKIDIGADNRGEIAFGALQAGLDLSYSPSMVCFTWAGYDETDEVSGDGHAELLDDGALEIILAYHNGDEAILKAVRLPSSTPAKGFDMQLTFTVECRTWPIQLTGNATRTRAALLASLPLRLQLHTPKIAGSHIYWHAPFVEDVEGATHVLDAKAGAFIYWPVRQFLEITFAPLQAESAQVTVLGHLDAPVEGISELAAVLKREQGHRVIEGTLALADGMEPEAVVAPLSVLPDDLVLRRKALWETMPADIARLTESRAIMHPAGPVFAAEGEARVLHELLWWIRAGQSQYDEAVLRQTMAIGLDKTATRLRDFCHMDDTPALLFALRDATQGSLPLAELVDEAILVAGRIGAWLDLLIPWNDINEGFRSALD